MDRLSYKRPKVDSKTKDVQKEVVVAITVIESEGEILKFLTRDLNKRVRSVLSLGSFMIN